MRRMCTVTDLVVDAAVPLHVALLAHVLVLAAYQLRHALRLLHLLQLLVLLLRLLALASRAKVGMCQGRYVAPSRPRARCLCAPAMKCPERGYCGGSGGGVPARGRQARVAAAHGGAASRSGSSSH